MRSVRCASCFGAARCRSIHQWHSSAVSFTLRSCTTKTDAPGGDSQRRYQTLGDYLHRLPPGFRELLLWSPALAAGYFAFYKQSVYYLPSTRRRLLSRPSTVECSSFSKDNSVSAEHEISIDLDAGTGGTVRGVLLTVEDTDGSGERGAPPPVPPFGSGDAAALQRLRVVRDADSDEVVGYSAARVLPCVAGRGRTRLVGDSQSG
ncbi:hypothetical protein ERJ75_001466000 [Trypanosoma vivax]|uniref:Uncharacterized protein n=1 Tax=Trypanosoma vivax (strain Y486) TaxID=1055687 RepID=G0TVQ1_TRYVY|nr:hypothetical protein ERJ75_001466000 [Trypanosoma vivax]CCC48017.1 conserved hypothetical protein [Trypanosoma vivax Y486]